MDQGLLVNLRAIRYCLEPVSTQDGAARRRYGNDDDAWMEDFSNPFDVDANKLMGSKAFRRLNGKTQVWQLIRNAHARNRLSHTFEVANIAALIADILGLNRALCFAGGLGHDIGHTPFGHQGENFLIHGLQRPFRHEIFSVIVAQCIERKGLGLNLTHQTLLCMRHHSRGEGELKSGAGLPEADAVMLADKIAYMFSDFNDIFNRKPSPEICVRREDHAQLIRDMDWFGKSQRERVFTCIAHLCLESAEANRVSFTRSEAAQRFDALKKQMYVVYRQVSASESIPTPVLQRVCCDLERLEPKIDPAILFALMNDNEAASLFDRAPTATDLEQLSLADVLPYLRGRQIALDDADLSW